MEELSALTGVVEALAKVSTGGAFNFAPRGNSEVVALGSDSQSQVNERIENAIVSCAACTSMARTRLPPSRSVTRAR